MEVTDIYKKLLRSSVFKRKPFIFLIHFLVWLFLYLLVCNDMLHYNNFIYSCRYFYHVYTIVLFCPFQFCWSCFSSQMSYSYVFFLSWPISLISITYKNMCEELFTGAWATYKWLYNWGKKRFPWSLATVNCLEYHSKSMMSVDGLSFI